MNRIVAVHIGRGVDAIGAQDGHGSPDEAHGGLHGPYLGGQELMQQAHLVHGVAKERRKEFRGGEVEKFLIRVPFN